MPQKSIGKHYDVIIFSIVNEMRNKMKPGEANIPTNATTLR